MTESKNIRKYLSIAEKNEIAEFHEKKSWNVYLKIGENFYNEIWCESGKVFSS